MNFRRQGLAAEYGGLEGASGGSIWPFVPATLSSGLLGYEESPYTPMEIWFPDFPG